MRDRDVDEILRRSSVAGPEPDPAILDRISGAMGASLHPVRPLPPAWMLTGGLMLIGAAVAAAAACVLGLYGIRKLGAGEIALIFPVLALLAWIVAEASTAEATPGSPRRIPAAWLPVLGSAVLTALFAALFHDWHAVRFVPRGVACLTAGVVTAMPAGLGAWLLLRRGVAVNPVTAGLAAGTLAGLAGVAMLELHCPLFEAPHILVWHTAVVPLCALLGALAARALSRGR